MRIGSLLLVITVLFVLTGCNKKEVKTNWNNVKEGSKNTWQKTKDSFSEGTEEFKESTK